MTQPNVGARYVSAAVTITLITVDPAEHLLEWTDGINEWVESYVSVPVALARFATLIEGVRQDRLFLNGEQEFASHAQRFLDSQLEPTLERSRFRLGQLVRVVGRDETYLATFLREERNADHKLNGVALVKITSHSDRRHVGEEIHVGISVLEPA